MTVYQRLLEAIADFDMPKAPQSYLGDAARYMVIDAHATDTVDGDDVPVYALYQMSLSLYTPIREDTVALCAALQQAIYAAGFTFPTVTPGGVTLDGARKCQILAFGRWDDWQPSTLMT